MESCKFLPRGHGERREMVTTVREDLRNALICFTRGDRPTARAIAGRAGYKAKLIKDDSLVRDVKEFIQGLKIE